MTSSDIIGLVITGSLSLLLTIMSIVLLTGRGSFLIAGFNTMSKSEKEQYDAKALWKFMGKILLPISVLIPVVYIASMNEIAWLTAAYIIMVFGLIIFAGIYANTNNRFKR